MPIAAVCQGCGRELRARDELAGRAVKCPDCAQPVHLPGGPAEPAGVVGAAGRPRRTPPPRPPGPAETDPGQSRPTEDVIVPWYQGTGITDGIPRRSRRRVDPAWEAVRSALNQIYFCGVAYIFVMLVLLVTNYAAFCGALFAAGGREIGAVRFIAMLPPVLVLLGFLKWADHLMQWVAGFYAYGAGVAIGVAILPVPVAGGLLLVILAACGLAFLAAAVGFIGGCVRCLAAPGHSSIRPFAVGAVAATIAHVGLLVVAAIASFGGQEGGMQGLLSHWLSLLSGISGVSANLLFALFLRGIPREFEDRQTERYLNEYLVLVLVFLGFGVLSTALIGAGVITGVGAAWVAAVLLICAIVNVVRFLQATSAARDAIRSHTRVTD